MFRKFVAGLVVFSLVLVAFNSVVFAQAKAPDVPIKIGVMAPVTGPAASLGVEQLNWAKLAVEDFNAASGWKVEVVEGPIKPCASDSSALFDASGGRFRF